MPPRFDGPSVSGRSDLQPLQKADYGPTNESIFLIRGGSGTRYFNLTSRLIRNPGQTAFWLLTAAALVDRKE